MPSSWRSGAVQASLTGFVEFVELQMVFTSRAGKKTLFNLSRSLSGLWNRCCHVCSRVFLRLDWPPRLKILGGDFCPKALNRGAEYAPLALKP